MKNNQNSNIHPIRRSISAEPIMLDIQQLVKTYENGHQAVKGVDLAIHQGEFIVLVGPSGCGKSSILRSIAGLEAITSGEIHLAGR
ncbi:sn-glycerol-3-phosphate ABC transporter ATP-binding protein UgpC, partial [Vibrio vulnificus]